MSDRVCTCTEDHASDVQLIACVQGPATCRESAADRLIDRYAPMIAGAAARACRSVGGGKSMQAADVDAARQGGRLGLYAAALKFDATLGVPFAGMAGRFVFGAARRELLLQLGWTMEGVPPPTSLINEVPALSAPLAPSAEDVVVSRGFGTLASIARELTEPARDLLIQLYVEDNSVTDIAAQRGVRQQTVSSQHKRILAAVRARLENVA